MNSGGGFCGIHVIALSLLDPPKQPVAMNVRSARMAARFMS
jgi:hypothetical protein